MRDEPFPLGGAHEDDPTAQLLREVLAREADAVRPSPDGLRRIRAEIARQPRLLPARRRWARVPVLAAAAVLAVAAAGGTALLRAVTHPSVGTDQVGGQVQPQIDRQEVREAPTSTLPVYVAGRQNDQTVLFREFRRAPATADVDTQVASAVTVAMLSAPADPDYVRLFASSPRPTVRASVTSQSIRLDISPAPRPAPGVTGEEARVALQQLVWTATAAAAVAAQAAPPGSGANAQPVPLGGRVVQITLDQGSQERFFGQLRIDVPLRRESGTVADPRAKVWITDPAEGSTLVRGTLTADGDAVALTDASVFVVLFRNDVPVRQEAVRLVASEASGGTRAPQPGQRGIWKITGWDVGTPGRYRLEVSSPGATHSSAGGEESAGKGPVSSPASSRTVAFWSDDKTFTVR
jgi:hypothetical protein